MQAIGIRELKSQLSQYIKLVQSGEVILVTDRNKVVAEIKQPAQAKYDSDANLEKYISKLASAGTIIKAIRQDSIIDIYYKKSKKNPKLDWQSAYNEIKEDR